MPRGPRRSGSSGERWYPPSKPLPAEDGIATSKQRGEMASTWWSKRFVAVLESYGLGGRMQRGRRYARTGQVLDLDVRPGVLSARVQGSRPDPYNVTIRLPEPTRRQWAAIESAMSHKVGFVARLLAGELPAELEDVFHVAGVALFPTSYRQLQCQCSCPDWGDPCKHLAAVLYVLADQLDADPWLALAWRGRTRDQLIEHFPLASRSPSQGPDLDPVAPWWPFAPGPLPELPERRTDAITP